MRSFQTMGVEQPLPGSGVFQRTFVEASHLTGYEPVSVLPLSRGPRQRGQLELASASATGAAKTAATARMAGNMEGVERWRENMRSHSRRECGKRQMQP